MKSVAQVIAELDPEYQRKTQELQANIQAKYDIAGAQMQLQRNISEAQMQLQRDIADQNSRDKWEIENKRNETTIEAEKIRAKNARELLERSNELEQQKISYKAIIELMSKGTGGLLDSYQERRKLILDGVEENRKLRNGATLSVINAFIQDKLAGRTMLREDYMAERNMAREMERMELQHKIKMAEMEMEHNARFILKAYELEGVHGAKVEIDRLINEWSK
ncbi:hypothetical protein [Undibacterium squillarum]|uniref:Uncharacterized protein n=1 Tax=Undibacterium squillarum TaxID=1131567 RepID=A0ABQ2Y3P3_9BURK|nr:hypothetical protein [Undibacterium squillarum]GGX54709.1 hypothetical protein GCM10010946_36650 [Undibacterium squillarum]